MSTMIVRRCILSVVCLIGVAVLAPVFAGPSPTGPGPAWASLAPVPTVGGPGFGVEGMSVARLGDKIIAALGFDSSFGDTDTTRIYSIASDTWLPNGASAPGTSSEGAGTSHGDRFYNLGGRVGGVARADLWSYELVSDSWTTLASMNQARAGLGVAVVGNAIYAIGGRTAVGGPCSGPPLDSVERYDIDTDTWSSVASLLSPRSDLAATTVGGKIYVFGGCAFGEGGTTTFLHDVDVYNPETDTWSTAPADMPTARAGMYAVETKGNTVYVIGGWDGVLPGLSTNESYKVATDTWTAGLLPMPTPRAEAGAVGTGGRIYIVGGSRPAFGASVDANEVFKP